MADEPPKKADGIEGGWAVEDPATLYPAECHFRIIVEKGFADEARLNEILSSSEVTAPLSPGSTSSGGRFRSLQVAVRLKDRAEGVRLDEALRGVAGVRLVL